MSLVASCCLGLAGADSWLPCGGVCGLIMGFPAGPFQRPYHFPKWDDALYFCGHPSTSHSSVFQRSMLHGTLCEESHYASRKFSSRMETGSILGPQDSCIFDPLSEGSAATCKMELLGYLRLHCWPSYALKFLHHESYSVMFTLSPGTNIKCLSGPSRPLFLKWTNKLKIRVI